MNRKAIEEEATWIQKKIWKERDILWPNEQRNHIQVLQPSAAAMLLGASYLELSTLGNPLFTPGGRRFQPAGILDRQAQRIAVSTEFAPHVMRFTGAHEVGHWMLHDQTIMHRDLPLDGSQSVQHDPIEQEANYFAGCFLLPEGLLRHVFGLQFQVRDQLAFTDICAFHLNPDNPQQLLNAGIDSLDRELALARCTHFNNRHLISLSQQFGVSNIAMAIRIKELGLCRWP